MRELSMKAPLLFAALANFNIYHVRERDIYES